MSAKDIRNIVLLGHSGSGKTTLAESMLYLTGGTDRLGRIADGNTVCDYDPEEIRRQISISLAVAPVEYDSCKINVLDVPGGFDFAGEVAEAVQAADAAVIVCSAKAGMSVGAEKAWKYCEKNSLPRLLYISKTDEENSDYNAAFNTLRERFGKNIAPVVAPIWDESKKVIGIIDLLHNRAFEFVPGGGRVEIEVPENKKPVLDELYDALKESVAETSEEFMEKFFAGEDFTYAEMIHGLRQGVKDLSLFPVVCGSAIQGMGTRILMDTIVELLPKPQDARALMAENEDGESSEFVVAPGALPTAFVFKTISDQYGKYSYVKVLSGSIKPDMPMVNARTGETEKLGRLYIPKGKKYTEVKELTCGDIGAIAKMDKVKTGDTLCEPRKVVKIEPIPFDEPCYSVAIAPKTRGQEDKMAQGLNRLNEEDPSFRVVNNAETHQMVHGPLAGYPVVNLKAVLYDGSYHPVDSSEIAFKTAANLAYKAAMPEASPVLLEPVCELKVTVPDQYMGDILGDLNKRRGRVMGMTPTGNGEQVIEAECPEAELMSYAIDLRSMTQSRGSFVMHFVRYEQCSADAQAKAVAAAKAMQEAE